MKKLFKVLALTLFTKLPTSFKVYLSNYMFRCYHHMSDDKKLNVWPKSMVIANYYHGIPVIVNDYSVFLATGFASTAFPEMPMGGFGFINYNGLINQPVIYVTKQTFMGNHLQYILAHEYGHIKNGHHELLLNGYTQLELKLEIEADLWAVEEVGPFKVEQSLNLIINGLTKYKHQFKESIVELEIRKYEVMKYYGNELSI